MNITLVIGNGFDLNLGLPTSYSDFYKYYAEVNEEKNLIQKEIADKPEQWSDLELAIGKISTQYKNVNSYVEDIDNVSDELTKYLKVVDNLPIQDIETIAKTVYDNLCSFSQFLDTPQKNNINRFLESISDKNKINLDVITFNYTSVFEKIVQQWDDEAIFDKIRNCNIHHIHQRLDESGILLGVNSPGQIANTALHNEYDVQVTVVKPIINSAFQLGVDSTCKETIEKAHLIILFGVSMGDTDKDWWHIIGNSLIGRNKRFVYCPYDTEHITETTKILRRNNRLKEWAFKKCNLGSEKRSDFFSKCIPLRENRMFNFGINNEEIKQNFRLVYSKLHPTYCTDHDVPLL